MMLGLRVRVFHLAMHLDDRMLAYQAREAVPEYLQDTTCRCMVVLMTAALIC